MAIMTDTGVSAMLIVLSWLITYCFHSTVFLGVALLAGRIIPTAKRYIRDWLLKTAFVGGIVSTTLFLIVPATPFSFTVYVTGQNETSVLAPTESDDARNESPVFMPAVSPGSQDIELVSTPISYESIQKIDTIWVNISLFSWILGSVVMGVRYLYRWRRFARTVRRRSRPVSEDLGNRLNDIKHHFGLKRKIRLSFSHAIECPMAIGIRGICLPDDFTTQLEYYEQSAALAHELAHILRFDPLWLIVSEINNILFFFQPLNRLARRRLISDSELLCDALALEKTNNPLALVSSLVKYAAGTTSRAVPRAVSSIAGRQLSLSERAMNILKSPHRKPAKKVTFAYLLVLAVLLLISGWISPVAKIVSPAEPVDPAIPDAVSSSPASHHDLPAQRDTTFTGSLKWIDGTDVRFELSEIEASTERSEDVESLSYGGMLEFSDGRQVQLTIMIENLDLSDEDTDPIKGHRLPFEEKLSEFVTGLLEKVMLRYDEESMPDKFEIRMRVDHDEDDSYGMVISLHTS